MDKRSRAKAQKVKIELPYKSKPESLPVAEDTEKAERVFGGGDTGGRYNMILLASARAYDLAPVSYTHLTLPTIYSV